MKGYIDLRDKVYGGFQQLKETAGPTAYAARLARYIRDASTIRARTMNEYGRAPSIEQIRDMIADARDKVAQVRLAAAQNAPDENEDAQLWATPGLIRIAAERSAMAERTAALRALAKLDEAAGDGTPEHPARDMVASRDIITMTATAFGLTYAEVTGRSKARHIVAIRHMAAWILTKRGRLSSVQVGKALNRDHSSVIHGRDQFEKRATPEQRDFALRLANWQNPLAEGTPEDGEAVQDAGCGAIAPDAGEIEDQAA
jgi:chromosomal replication initiator protein